MTAIEDLAKLVANEDRRLERVARDHGLTVEQVRLAERVGITPDEYAVWLVGFSEDIQREYGADEEAIEAPRVESEPDLVFAGCYMPRELRDIVDSIARRHGESRSSVFRAACVEYARTHLRP